MSVSPPFPPLPFCVGRRDLKHKPREGRGGAGVGTWPHIAFLQAKGAQFLNSHPILAPRILSCHSTSPSHCRSPLQPPFSHLKAREGALSPPGPHMQDITWTELQDLFVAPLDKAWLSSAVFHPPAKMKPQGFVELIQGCLEKVTRNRKLIVGS